MREFSILNDINKFEKEISNCRTFYDSEIEFLLSKFINEHLDNCVVYIDKKLERKNRAVEEKI